MLDHINSVKGGVVTLENHVTEGGIGSLMADNGVGQKLKRLGLNDTYAHGGSRAYLMRYYGLDALALTRLCYLTAVAGADIIKEDHGLTNQDAAPFKARVKACAAAVARANQERGDLGDPSRALYFANIGGHADQVRDLAYYAKDAGADGILLMPGLFGFDAMTDWRRMLILACQSWRTPVILAPMCCPPIMATGMGCCLGN